MRKIWSLFLLAFIIISTGTSYKEEKKTIMNRLKIGEDIKHVAQEDLLNNLGSFEKEFGDSRIYVRSPEGDTGTVLIKRLQNALDAGYTLIDDTEGYNSRPDIIAKKEAEKSRIMNRVKVGNEIKHIDQQTLLDNLDAYAKHRSSDRVYVTTPDGKRGTVEMRELRDVLNAGYQLIDDTEGYNNRPDIIAKRNAETDNAFIQLDTVKKKSFNIEQYFDYIKESVINLKSLKMNNLLIPVLSLIFIGLIITLSNKNTPPKYLIINDNTWRLVKIILAVAALYIAYLFALNGRYTEQGDYVDSRQLEYRDKWKLKMRNE